MHDAPLAYLGGFGFEQVHLLQPRICCWLVHLEVWVSVVELEVQDPQIFRYSSHLIKSIIKICVKFCSSLPIWWSCRVMTL